MKLPLAYKPERSTPRPIPAPDQKFVQTSGTKKPDQKIGFFHRHNVLINAWSTADAYALYADQPSYAQPYAHHGQQNPLCAETGAEFRQNPSGHASDRDE